jgi:hypothetical protein
MRCPKTWLASLMSLSILLDPGSALAQGAPAARRDMEQALKRRGLALEKIELERMNVIDRLEFLPIPFPPPFPPRPPFPPLPPRLPPFPPRWPPFPPRICVVPPATAPAAIDVHRSLFVHDRATLDASGGGFTANFSLRRTLDQIAAQVASVVSGTPPDAVGIFRQFWDTQNAAPGVTSGPHCSDNGGTVNDFPITCPRNEGREAVGTDTDVKARIDEYEVLALVNRIDLAHEGWRNCGEHRIIYGKRVGATFAKNLIIFEAVLPNPRPGCREGCVPVAEFWKSLSAVDDAVVRAQRLDTFFYAGLPGFRPVVHVDHYSATGVTSSYGSSGSGQIRTNQFLQTPGFQPWLLKEFKTVIDCGVIPCSFAVVPTMVKVNPHGPLWNEDNADPRAIDFRSDTLLQTASLASGTLMGIGYGVDPANDAGQSMSLVGLGFVDNYRDQMNSATATTFRSGLVTGSLTADQMANRALTQSCAGCHQPSTFDLHVSGSIGTVLAPVGSPVPTTDRWPDSASFVHVDVKPASVRPELAANPAAFGTGMGQTISPALLDFFLPERKSFLLGQLDQARCSCVRRFRFLDPARRARALELERRVGARFESRLEALGQRIAELQAGPAPGEIEAQKVAGERASLLEERDRLLVAELGRRGITLPDAELLDLRPRPLKLRAASRAKGNVALERALRAAEVNQLLRREPARRTVTGSFRVH